MKSVTSLSLVLLGGILFPISVEAESSRALLQVSATVPPKCVIASPNTLESQTAGVKFLVRCTKGTPLPESFAGPVVNRGESENGYYRLATAARPERNREKASTTLAPILRELAPKGSIVTERGGEVVVILSLDF